MVITNQKKIEYTIGSDDESSNENKVISVSRLGQEKMENIRLLRKYVSESSRILPSRVTSVSLKIQKELSRAIKRARLLALL